MNSSTDKTYVVIFAGGVGARMEGANIPKQFLELGGKPIIAYTIDHFNTHEQVDEIVVVCVEEWIDYLEGIVEKYRFEKVKAIVPGGKTGQESIFKGLAAIKRDLKPDLASVVLIHDGVRPLIDHETISACIDSVKTNGCTATVSPSSETVLEVEDDGALNVMDRSKCKLARAPQGFIFNDLYAAHLESQKQELEDFIDSVSLMAHFGYSIAMVEGPIDNIKITTKKDYFAFKGYMDYKELGQLW